ncbi:NADPH-dependent 7-cyano-7-deazaguanine reductase QueF [Alkalisalibacterium limincola]|uniref:NADPH-dependent 7-cyano-7-deazaguanine reductase n=1 Tax=Alkalisalibacterium limincola TaxID=2699169 RepID=A0A5C8KR66_9GAMM|nr:NADPH-dependent 7-cyano-7-deazaguanine reductase QueF [Alkalisalibacterium limincola]TXK62376.1 NADPH-dependent 7-cyano-7-deazaguanine reductase QueF [Alkalisalibacterium limincola]
MTTPESSLLGKPTAYPDAYDPALLYPIPRAPKRHELGIDGALPFTGCDVWNAYELGWLDARGKPKVALGEFRVPADSPNIIESKSFKLYLNSHAQERYDGPDALRARLVEDLSAAAGAPVSVVVVPTTVSGHGQVEGLSGDTIDDLPVAIDHYGPPRPDFLRADGGEVVEETLVSHLLKSNCPVTGQPDWASLQLRYHGPKIDRAGLLRYLVSFRGHSDFHEQCVERIFTDLMRQCRPQRLSVYARYTRRGGLDINPFRSSSGETQPGNPRTVRQ